MRDVRKNLKCFVLLEIAIALAIIGVVAGISLPLMKTYFSQKSIQTTKNHQQQIANALAAYLAANHRLPLPCSTDEPMAGVESPEEMEICKGTVPFRTLGISEQTAKDGNKRWFTYMVHPNLTSKKLKGFCYNSDNSIYPKSQYFCEVVQGDKYITGIDDGKNELVLNPEPNKPWGNFIAFAIISHGINGGGSILPNGKGRTTLKNNDEYKLLNATANNKFVSKDFSIHNFDDIVFWCSRNELMSHYLKINCLWE